MPKLVMFARFRHFGENECNEQNFVQLRQARWKQLIMILSFRRLSDQENKLKSTQRQLETVQSELFEVSSKASDKAEAKSESIELLLNDLETSQQRAAIAEKEAQELKEQLRVLQDATIGFVKVNSGGLQWLLCD